MGFEVINLTNIPIFMNIDGEGTTEQLFIQMIPPGGVSFCFNPGVYRITDECRRQLLAVVCNSLGYRIIPYIFPSNVIIVQPCTCHGIVPGPSPMWDDYFLRFFDFFSYFLANKHIGVKITNRSNEAIAVASAKNGQENRLEFLNPHSTSKCMGAGKYFLIRPSGSLQFNVLQTGVCTMHPDAMPFIDPHICGCVVHPYLSADRQSFLLQLLNFMVTKFVNRPDMAYDRRFKIVNKSNIEFAIASRSTARVKLFELVAPGGISEKIPIGEYGITHNHEIYAIVFCNSVGTRVIPFKSGILDLVEVQCVTPILPKRYESPTTEWDTWLLMFIHLFFSEFPTYLQKANVEPETHFEIVNNGLSNIVIKSKKPEEVNHSEIVVPSLTSNCIKEGIYEVRNSDESVNVLLICKASGWFSEPCLPPSILIQSSFCNKNCISPARGWESWVLGFLNVMPQ